MAPLLERTLLDAGVEIAYESQVIDVVREGDAVSHVIAAAKDGLKAIAGRVFIDATGDADVAATAGCKYEFGDQEGRPMAASLIIHVERVDEEALLGYITGEDDPRFRKKLSELRSDGVDCYNYDNITVKMTRDGSFMINGRALPEIDGTDPGARTGAYIEERGKVEGTLELFREHWPGCADVSLRAVATSLGIRESRRIEAIGRLSVRDVVEGRPVPDTIGFTAYPWDINQGADDVNPKELIKPPVIPIPYGVMVPRGVAKLICPGRAINCERVVLGPMRVQGPIMAMGEAAGTAAAMALRGGVGFGGVDADELRAVLAVAGAIL